MLTQYTFIDASVAELQDALAHRCPDPAIADDIRAAIDRHRQRDPRPPVTSDRLWHGNLQWLGWQYGPTAQHPYSPRWHRK